MPPATYSCTSARIGLGAPRLPGSGAGSLVASLPPVRGRAEGLRPSCPLSFGGELLALLMRVCHVAKHEQTSGTLLGGGGRLDSREVRTVGERPRLELQRLSGL